MKDRPIIFSAAMVLAMLRGDKTQTRRLRWSTPKQKEGKSPRARRETHLARLAPGDRLYVREAWSTEAADDHRRPRDLGQETPIYYAADKTWLHPEFRTSSLGFGRPGIHMPRWASRLTLIVTQVRLQPLHDITEADAINEGCLWDSADGHDVWYIPGAHLPRHGATAVECFRELWGTLHSRIGERWIDNPEVVALTFQTKRGNIDRLEP